MARVSTKTGLANLAASLMKIDAVENIDPPDQGSKFAKKAAQWYEESRRETLADHVWNSAIKRVQLAADSTAPLFGYGVRYLLPADYIRVATIGDEDDPETDYKIEGRYILSAVTAPLNLRYVYDLEDLTVMSPKLIGAFARKLAANMAYDMTGNRTFADEMEGKYQLYLSDGAGIDGQESPPTHKIRRSRWKNAKEGRAIRGSVYQGRVVT